jgi:hypothetical protein
LRDRAGEQVGYHRPIRPQRFRVELQAGSGQGLAPGSAGVDELLAREVTQDHIDPGASLHGRGLRVEGLEVTGLERSEEGDHLGRRDQTREFPVHGERRGLGDRRSLGFEPGALGIGEAPEQHAHEQRDGQRQRERQGCQMVAHGTVTRTTSKGGHVARVASPEVLSPAAVVFRASPRMIRVRYELYWIKHSSDASTTTREVDVTKFVTLTRFRPEPGWVRSEARPCMAGSWGVRQGDRPALTRIRSPPGHFTPILHPRRPPSP